MEGESDTSHTRQETLVRIGAAIGVALALGMGCYALLEAVRPASGLVSFSFLLVLPAVISAFVSYVADPWGKRTLQIYLMVPAWILLVVIVVSAVVLKEGVICILILSPLWLLSGCAGSLITYKLRKRLRKGRTYCSVLLLLPVVAMQVEPLIPLPAQNYVVTRSAVIAAPADKIWPLLRGIPDVRRGEGAWNISQDVIGIPRPLGARLIGSGIGAVRLADWGEHVRFKERIIQWQWQRRIGWSFNFDDIAGWRYTDRHLMPDSPYFRVIDGGYSLTPVDGTHYRVSIDTRYWIRTPVNAYSSLWGELFLGDLEHNLLGLIKQRAEQQSAN